MEIKSKFWSTILRLTKHLLFSLAGTGTNTLVLWLLKTYAFPGGSWFQIVLLSPAIAFECGNVVNFLMSSKIVWRDTMKGQSIGRYMKSFVYYNLSYTTVLFLNLAILALLERLTGWDVVICNLIAMFFSGMINFAMNNFVIFRRRTQTEQ